MTTSTPVRYISIQVEAHGTIHRRVVRRSFFVPVAFVVCLVMYLAGAYYFNSVVFIGNLDGLARTANAFYVLFSRDPHLAAIGFVWPVLPSLLQLAILPVVQPAGLVEYSGSILSAISGSGVVVVLGMILGGFGITGVSRVLLLAPVALHPQLFYQASAGVAEMPFLFFIVLATYAYLRLRSNGMYVVLLGLAIAFSFLVRYESIAFIMGFSVLLIFYWRRETRFGTAETEHWFPSSEPAQSRRKLNYRERFTIVEGRLITTLLPVAYAVGVWILFNWLIMGDPLFFLRSQYSLVNAPDVARNVGPGHPLFAAMWSFPETAHYVIFRVLDVQAGLLVMVPLAVVASIWRRDYRVPVVLVLLGSIVGFTAYQVFSGSLPSYLRYWMYATPFMLILTGVVIDDLAPKGRIPRFVLSVAGSAVLAFGAYSSIAGLADPRGGQDEQRLGLHLQGNTAAEEAIRAYDGHWIHRVDAPLVAAELDRYSAEGLTMIGVETEFYGLLKTKHPQRLAIVSDRDYQSLLEHPADRVKYIFGTTGQLGDGNDIVSRMYPGLYDGKVPWAKYVGNVPGTIMPWKIFEVDFANPNVPDELRGNATQ